jgi:hypothetical protein
MSNALSIWWSILCAAAVLNAALWILSARTIGRPDWQLAAPDDALRRRLLWLSAVYVLGCAFRSFLPMSDIPRLCLVDTWISRIFVGRSVATVAELCFVAQWALLLRYAATSTGDRFAMQVSHALVPLIAIAEVCSWTAVLTTNYLLHAVENSLWTLGAALALIAIALLRPRLDVAGKRFAGAAIVCSAVYITYMAGGDVPMWVARWRGQPGGWHAGISAVDGLRTAVQRCVVSREWAAWRDDVPWLSLYFTVAVWISIALAHVPPLRAAARTQSERERPPLPTDR